MSGHALPLTSLLSACLAVASLWLPTRLRSLACGLTLAAFLGLCLAQGTLDWRALPALAALFAGALWAARGQALGWLVFVGLALAIGFGLAPGFASLPLSEAAPLKPGSPPHALQLNPAKLLLALALLFWLVPTAHNAGDWRKALGAAILPALLTATLVLAGGVILGLLNWRPGLPPLALTLTWVALNLLITCSAEEAFFRGVVQRGLGRWLPAGWAISLAGLAFGLAHFAGGARYMVLATLAGVGYGIAYWRSGQRIEAAILAHFGLNAAHLALFDYPPG